MHVTHKFVFLILIASLNVINSNADETSPAPDDDTKRKLIEKMATPLEEEKVFYRWQSKESGDNLLAAGKMTDAVHGYFMNMSITQGNFAAGRGVYMSENMHSASDYVGKDGLGSMIEVRLAKGTKTLDVSNGKIAYQLKQIGITPADVYRLDPNVAVKYDGANQWWVSKVKEGASFKPFNGHNRDLPTLAQDLDRITNVAKPAFIRLVSPRIKEIMAKNPDSLADPSLYRFLTDEEGAAALNGFVVSVKNPRDEGKLHEFSRTSMGFNMSKRLNLYQKISSIETRFASVDSLIERYKNNPPELTKILKVRLSSEASAYDLLRDLTSLKSNAERLGPWSKIALGPVLVSVNQRIDLTHAQLDEAHSLTQGLGVDSNLIRSLAGSNSPLIENGDSNLSDLRALVSVTGKPEDIVHLQHQLNDQQRSANLMAEVLSSPLGTSQALIETNGHKMDARYLLKSILESHLEIDQKLTLLRKFSDRLDKPEISSQVVQYLTSNKFDPKLNRAVLETGIKFGNIESLLRITKSLGGTEALDVKRTLLDHANELCAKSDASTLLHKIVSGFTGEEKNNLLDKIFGQDRVSASEKIKAVQTINEDDLGQIGFTQKLSKLIVRNSPHLLNELPKSETVQKLAKLIVSQDRPLFVRALIESKLDTNHKAFGIIEYLRSAKNPPISSQEAQALFDNFIQTANPSLEILKELGLRTEGYIPALLAAMATRLTPNQAMDGVRLIYEKATSLEKSRIATAMIPNLPKLLEPPIDAGRLQAMFQIAANHKMEKAFYSYARAGAQIEVIERLNAVIHDPRFTPIKLKPANNGRCRSLVVALRGWLSP